MSFNDTDDVATCRSPPPPMYQVLGSRWLDSSCRTRTQLPLVFDFEQSRNILQRPEQSFQALNLHRQGQNCTMRLRSKSDPLADHLRASPVDHQRLVSRHQLWRTTTFFFIIRSQDLFALRFNNPTRKSFQVAVRNLLLYPAAMINLRVVVSSSPHFHLI